jgi:hypothetical protein
MSSAKALRVFFAGGASSAVSGELMVEAWDGQKENADGDDSNVVVVVVVRLRLGVREMMDTPRGEHIRVFALKMLAFPAVFAGSFPACRGRTRCLVSRRAGSGWREWADTNFLLFTGN